MKWIFRVFMVSALVLLLASCKYKLVTDHLQPVNTNTSEYVSSEGYKQVYCGLDTNAMNPGAPKPKEVLVGYKRLYRSGTPPFPCTDWSNGLYRGAFRFDLSKYQGKKIVAATLNLTLGRADYIYSNGTVASSEGDWVKSIGLATSEWWLQPSPYVTESSPFPWKAIPGMPDLPHGANPPAVKTAAFTFDGMLTYHINVTDVLRDWIDGKEPNMGFILIGTNENIVKNNRDAALSPVDSISLDILHSVPK